MKDVLPHLASAVAGISALISLISVRTARRSFAVARATGQVSYEGTRFSREPPLELVLTSVTFRGPTKMGHDGILLAVESKKWLKTDEDNIEIVAEGRLRNRLNQELLLTFRDHPKSSRRIRYAHRNQSVWRLDDETVELGRAVLAPASDVKVVWIDRRPPETWATLRKSNSGFMREGRPPRAMRISLSDLLKLARNPTIPLTALRSDKLPRIGFRIIGETRATERLATIWNAEVTADPAEIFDRANNKLFDPADGPCTIQGPIDDDIIRYRVEYDSVLASIQHRRIIHLAGRD